jgi:hypothetical protein
MDVGNNDSASGLAKSSARTTRGSGVASSPLSKSIKSRKDRSQYAPVSANDQFALMRKNASLAAATRNGVAVAVVQEDESFIIGPAAADAATSSDKTVIHNEALARAILADD